ncbi:MAG: hypothetical protein A2583_05375 [Bdellovibrionales bacterium RIFOXYD1_FULL_53_11]|nr:MAG: hypothetical protein A2583_05375 [Bdellovibrionales bacterium RIFOXYD1_FULL_53_11]
MGENGFIGRRSELESLEAAYHKSGGRLVAVYGRRRIGKSAIAKKFCTGKSALVFEALEKKPTSQQIGHFTSQLKTQIDDPLLKQLQFASWQEVFGFLTEYLRRKSGKTVVFFDELPWMAVGRTGLVSLLKFYWDNHWKNLDVMLILCGSINSFMVKNVIRSKALYGRFSLEMKIDEFSPKEVHLMLGRKRSKDEALKYLMTLGGVPKYLEEVNTSRSFSQNMNEILFTKHGAMINEIDRIFYSQFKEPQNYRRIAKVLSSGPLSMDGISRKTGMSSGGGLAYYLENLELAGFIGIHAPFDRGPDSRLRKYKLVDAYLLFYFKYIEPNMRVIRDNARTDLFRTLVEPVWKPWTGIAFENMCLKNHVAISSALGFEGEVVWFGPYWERGEKGFQIDLLFRRADKVLTLCELKYSDKPLGPEIIPEVERKCQLIRVPRGFTLERAVIAPYGITAEVEKSGYFHHVMTLEDFF